VCCVCVCCACVSARVGYERMCLCESEWVQVASRAYVSSVAKAAEDVCGFSPGFLATGRERDFVRHMRSGVAIRLDSFWVSVPVRTRQRTIKQVLWPVFLPHETFGTLVDVGALSRFVPPGGEAISEFWNAASGEPWWPSHPVAQMPVDRRRFTVPLLLHADEGTSAKKKPIMILSWNPALVHSGCSWETRHLIACVPSKAFVWGPSGENLTLDPILEAISTSFAHLLAGRWPAVADSVSRGRIRNQMQNARFAHDGAFWHAAFVGLKGDQKFMKACFLPARHFSTNKCCFHCWASKTNLGLAYSNTSPSALWRLTFETHAAWEQHSFRRNAYRNPLLRLPGMHKSLILDDPLHYLWLGVAQDLCGTLIQLLVEGGMFVTLTDAFDAFEAFSMRHGYRPF